MATRDAKSRPVRYRPAPSYPFPRLNSLKWHLNPIRQLEWRATAYRGRSSVWTYVLIALALRRMVKRQLGPEHVAVDKLKPGQAIQIRTIPMATKADRRAARRPA